MEGLNLLLSLGGLDLNGDLEVFQVWSRTRHSAKAAEICFAFDFRLYGVDTDPKLRGQRVANEYHGATGESAK